MATRVVVRTVVVGHGSREPSANSELEAFVAAWAARRPDLDVRSGYVELARPTLDEALESAARDSLTDGAPVVALPLFLFASGHVKNDLPLALERVRARFPLVRCSAARALGVDPSLGELMHERAAIETGRAAKTAVVVVGRGASDPDANGDFVKLVRLYAEGRGYLQVVPTFIGITRPLVDETLDLVARARPERIRIVPYLLFGGRLVAKLEQIAQAFRQSHPWSPVDVAPPLGTDARIFALLDRRLQEALDGAAPLPCDACQYRTPLPGREQHVGGLKALLWSLRHGFTHTQAAPHVHAHKPIVKHVLVCGNADCADRGSLALLDSLRRAVESAGRKHEIRVTRTSCMGRCGEGPTVVVYPDGIWYRGVRAADAQEITDEHLLADRLVARLVDNIMQ